MERMFINWLIEVLNMRYTFFIGFMIGCGIWTTAYTQENLRLNLDLLFQDNYIKLPKDFSVDQDTSQTKIYVDKFLQKAKKNRDTLKMSDGYYMAALLTSNQAKTIQYTDSIIKLTKNISDFNYPAKAHLLKARVYGLQSRAKEAMDQLVIADTYANKNNNIDQKFKARYFIALYKSDYDELEEALQSFKEVAAYYETKFKEDKRYEYDRIKSLYALAYSYNLNKKHDSAIYVNKVASRLSLATKDKTLYDRIIILNAVALYNQEKYQSSLDSILKYQNLIKNGQSSVGTRVVADYYLGLNYKKLGVDETAITHLKKVDSIIFTENYFVPNRRKTYEIIINHYKNKGDKEKQLFYINRLLQMDSILYKKSSVTYRKLNKEYTTPNLINEKEGIIKSLEKSKQHTTILAIGLVMLSLLLICILIWNNNKKKIYKRRFLELINQETNPKIIPNKDKARTQKPYEFEISQIIVDDILERLRSFEENKEFLKPNITLQELSNEFATNSKYLSIVINTHKQKSFKKYINELRIANVIDELKKNTKLQKYTIQAIAREAGFNNAEVFSRSFYKTTGIYPSFFLKELEKNHARAL